MSGCDTSPLSLINASNLTGGRPKIFNSNTRAGYSKVGNQKLENNVIECLNVAEALYQMEAKYYSMFENAVSGFFKTRAGYSKVGNQKLENTVIECLNVAEALYQMEAKYYSMFENAVSAFFKQ